jgi:hypothetical protein
MAEEERPPDASLDDEIFILTKSDLVQPVAGEPQSRHVFAVSGGAADGE